METKTTDRTRLYEEMKAACLTRHRSGGNQELVVFRSLADMCRVLHEFFPIPLFASEDSPAAMMAGVICKEATAVTGLDIVLQRGRRVRNGFTHVYVDPEHTFTQCWDLKGKVYPHEGVCAFDKSSTMEYIASTVESKEFSTPAVLEYGIARLEENIFLRCSALAEEQVLLLSAEDASVVVHERFTLSRPAGSAGTMLLLPAVRITH